MLRKRLRAMVRVVTVHSCHIIDIVVLHRIDKLLNQALLELKAREVLGGVLLRNGLLVSVSVDLVASVLDETADARTML